MNKKLKEQLELVIIQCSALKAKLDEAHARNQQYEAEIEKLHRQLENPSPAEDPQPPETAPKAEEPQPAEEPAAAATELAAPQTEEAPAAKEPAAPAKSEPIATFTPEAEHAPAVSPVPQPENAPPAAAETPSPEVPAPAAEAPEAQSFQNILETGAELVSQAVATSKEYIQQLEATHPGGCNSLTEIIRSRTDLFKVEISGIIGGFGTAAEKREKMNSALVKLVQYFENVK